VLLEGNQEERKSPIEGKKNKSFREPPRKKLNTN
jgi:hypothetical protein